VNPFATSLNLSLHLGSPIWKATLMASIIGQAIPTSKLVEKNYFMRHHKQHKYLDMIHQLTALECNKALLALKYNYQMINMPSNYLECTAMALLLKIACQSYFFSF
jgi:hypothetical protein